MLFSIRPSSTAASLAVLPTCWACQVIPGSKEHAIAPLYPANTCGTLMPCSFAGRGGGLPLRRALVQIIVR